MEKCTRNVPCFLNIHCLTMIKKGFFWPDTNSGSRIAIQESGVCALSLRGSSRVVRLAELSQCLGPEADTQDFMTLANDRSAEDRDAWAGPECRPVRFYSYPKHF